MLEGDNQRDILLILKALGTNYPILNEYGLGLTKIPLFVIGKGQTQKAKELFSNKDIPSLNEFMPLREVKRIFMEANSAFVIYPYSASRKGQDFVPFLEAISKTGEISGTKINASPLVIAEGIPLGYDLQRAFTVFLEDDLTDANIDLEEVVPADDELTVVADKIQTILSNATSQDEKALLAASCFIYPCILQEGRQEKFENLLENAKRLATLNDENWDVNGLAEAFIQALYAWQETNNFCDIYELPNLGMGVVERMEEIMLFDGTFIYMKDELLKKICAPLLGVFSIDIIKQELMKVGILCPSAKRTYGTKVGFYNLAGQYERIRLLRFAAEKLKHPGEMDFLELCIEEKGEGTDGNIFNSDWKL